MTADPPADTPEDPEQAQPPLEVRDPTLARALHVLRSRHPLDEDRWRALEPSFLALVSGAEGKGRATNLGPSFACFSLLLGHGHDAPDGLLATTNHPRLLAPLLELATARLWGELCAALRVGAKTRHDAVLAELLEREREASKRRSAAQVTLTKVLPSLEWALPSLIPLRARVAIRAEAPGESDPRGMRAYTDGRDIYLPSRIALFESPRHNELAYVRLLVHEALHLSGGSFEEGACQQAARHVVRRLREHGHLADNLPRSSRYPNTLRGVTELFGESGELFFNLLNCVEDSRVERRIPALLPGFVAAVAYVDQGARALARPAVFGSSLIQLLQAVLVELAGRTAKPPAAYAASFTEVRATLASFRALVSPTLAESIVAATDLCLWFVRHVGPGDRAQLVSELTRRRPVPQESYERRVDLRPLGRREPAEVRPRMNLDMFSSLSTEGEIVPEYDFWKARVREDGASVELHVWDPRRAGVVGRAVRSEVAVATTRPVASSSFRMSGARLSPTRLVRLLATKRAGGAVDGRVFRGREIQATDVQATVVVDLSVSMVHYRPDGARPLERAVGWIEDLATQLGDGAPLAIYGCIDGGPEKVRMFRVKERGAPLTRETLESFHGYGHGGFRMGAVLRWLAKKSVERTRVFLLTDTGSHYVTRGMRHVWKFEDLETKLCFDCPRPGSTCDLERPFPDELWLAKNGAVFEPVEYEVEDIRHALGSTSHLLDPHVVLLTENWGDALCDHTFGPLGWSKV
ncbi:MAG TPA: hypothetical protein PK141_15485 [Polyangiaceae bacterium]|nr:hypothetical protein [Polyangiaceae bacterium]